MKKATILTTCLLVFGAIQLSFAQTVQLARWNSVGAIPTADFFAPALTHASVMTSNLVVGSGLGRTGGTPAGNSFAALGYSTTSSNAAMTANHYWETVIQPSSGFSASYSTIVYRFRAPNSGPKTSQWAYSTNGTTFTWLQPTNAVLDTYTDRTVTLSGVAELQNVSGRVWFRMCAWGGSAGSGTWGVFGQNADVITFSGTVASTGPVAPTVTITPPGPHSVAVSNALALAVAVTPAGSGVSSWTLLPTYTGTASLSSGSFSFTPAVGDASKTFTLTVLGTNIVGTRTNTASIAVTAYVPPMPVITFSPAAPYSIMATYTQRVGISILPVGSGMSEWTLLPSNYTGTATLVGTNFTFTTKQADGPATYTLSVVATNVHGARTNTGDIAVTTYAPPPPPGSIFVNFEGVTKGDYNPGNVTIGGKVWIMDGTFIGAPTDPDKKFDTRAARMRYQSTGTLSTIASATRLVTNGISTFSFWYASYHASAIEAVQLVVEMSEDNVVWAELDTFNTTNVNVLTYRSVDVFAAEPVYVRIRVAGGAANGHRANIDNITIGEYVPIVVSEYDKFLLKYNVTPSDPGTAEDDDLDGDGVTNIAEKAANTNPYDPDSK